MLSPAVCFLRLVQRLTLPDFNFPVPDQVPTEQRSRLGPLLGDIEVAELVDKDSVPGKLGLAGRLDGPEGGCPAGRGVAVLLLGAEAGHAQPVVVLRLGLQAADHVLLRLEGHGARPPVLPDPLPAWDAVATQEGGQEHGVSCAPREPRVRPHPA